MFSNFSTQACEKAVIAPDIIKKGERLWRLKNRQQDQCKTQIEAALCSLISAMDRLQSVDIISDELRRFEELSWDSEHNPSCNYMYLN